MANVVMILGKSGTGKSTSIKTLDPAETVIINVLGKKLPFKGSNTIYNTEKKNLFRIEDYQQMISLLLACDKQANIKNIILDDVIYVMRKEYFKRAKEAGYSKYTELAQHFQQIISTCESMREDINVFMILHSEDVQSEKTTVGYKVSTIGQLLDSQYNPIEVVPMVLYSSIKFDEKGNPTYGFYTHATMEGTIQIPAKTPDEMFTEDFIPNDLGAVVKAMNEYYG
jgi:ABC-type dipeptide/oligopeptide/nickel transport system ATPase component